MYAPARIYVYVVLHICAHVPSIDDLDEIQKEIRAMWDLQNSPHVTKVFGSFVVDDNLWIVMEFLGGGCIQDLVCSLVWKPPKCLSPMLTYLNLSPPWGDLHHPEEPEGTAGRSHRHHSKGDSVGVGVPALSK